MTQAPFITRIVQARQSGGVAGPGPEPASREDAFEAQRLTSVALNETVRGWKIASHPTLGPIGAPIFAGVTIAEGGAWPLVPGTGVEIEVALMIERDLPPGRYSAEDIGAAIGGYRLGVELVRGRLGAGNTNLFAFLGDLMANAGYVLGAETRRYDGAPVHNQRCRFFVGGERLHDAPANPPALDPLAVTAAWLARGDDRLGGIRAGQFVTTGSVCDIVPAPHKGPAVAELDGLGAVRFDLV